MKFRILFIISVVALSIGCASKKVKKRDVKVTIDRNVISCRYIGNVTGTSQSDALKQVNEWDGATHLVWVSDAEGKVYSCD